MIRVFLGKSGVFLWGKQAPLDDGQEEECFSLKTVTLRTRIKADLGSPFHNILLTTSYFRCLSSELPHIHTGFSLQQRQQSPALTDGLQIRGTDVITWLCGLKDKHQKIHLLLSLRRLFLYLRLAFQQIKPPLNFGRLLNPAVFLRNEYAWDNAHLLHNMTFIT